MRTFLIIPALATALLAASPALALSGIPNVPSLWPADGAFDAPADGTVTRDTQDTAQDKKKK